MLSLQVRIWRHHLEPSPVFPISEQNSYRSHARNTDSPGMAAGGAVKLGVNCLF